MTSSALNFSFYLLSYIPKERDHIRRKINNKNKNIYEWNQYYNYFDLPKLELVRPIQQIIKLPLPYLTKATIFLKPAKKIFCKKWQGKRKSNVKTSLYSNLSTLYQEILTFSPSDIQRRMFLKACEQWHIQAIWETGIPV